jgi:hypothetical protein
MDQPMKTNDTPRARRTGGRSGARNNAATGEARIQISTRQARPTAIPAVEAARISSSDRSGLWTSAEASPMRTKYWVNRTTRLATAMSPKAAGASSRDTVAV